LKIQTSASLLIFLIGLYSFFLKQNTNNTNSSELEIAVTLDLACESWTNPRCQIHLRTPECESSPCLGNRETRGGNANRTEPNGSPRRTPGGSGASSRTASRNAHSQLPREL